MLKTCELFKSLSILRCKNNKFKTAYINTRLKSWDSTKLQEDIKIGKEMMRKNRGDEYYNKLQFLEKSNQTSDYIVMMQQPMDFSPKGLLKKWRERKQRTERFMQQYIPERQKILGSDLAAAHFLLHRGGKVQFEHSGSRWWTEEDEDNLPKTYNPDVKVTAIRCENMELYYEGLENLNNLHSLKYISFRNVPTFDNFCLDRVSGSQFTNLEILDIYNTNCTYRGLMCLYRLRNLKFVIFDVPQDSIEFQLAASMVEETLPELQIVSEANHQYT